MTFVEQLGETCKSILVSFYYFVLRLSQSFRSRQIGYLGGPVIHTGVDIERN